MGGEASMQGDVYSFGILVLEMFTGKRPTHELFTDGFNLHSYVKLALPQNLVDVAEPNLMLKHSRETDNREEIKVENGTTNVNHIHTQMDDKVHKCLISVFQVGLACSMESPKERITMEVATQEFHHIKNEFLES